MTPKQRAEQQGVVERELVTIAKAELDAYVAVVEAAQAFVDHGIEAVILDSDRVPVPELDALEAALARLQPEPSEEQG